MGKTDNGYTHTETEKIQRSFYRTKEREKITVEAVEAKGIQSSTNQKLRSLIIWHEAQKKAHTLINGYF
jgi:hypothetical protein